MGGSGVNTAGRDINAIDAGGTELARYRVSAGERVLMGWRRGAGIGIEVTDRPIEGRARGYVVDHGFRCLEQLTAFVEDYLAQAERFNSCPMGGEALVGILEQSETEVTEGLLAAIGRR
jgi:hypothetical protein